MINKAMFSALFSHPDLNRDKICEQLYELADIVASKVVSTIDKEEIRSELFSWVVTRIDKYDTSKKSAAYSYFYCIMERESWKIAKSKKLSPLCSDARLSTEDDGLIAMQSSGAEAAKLTRISDLEPVTMKTSPQATPVKLLEKTIRRAREEQGKYPSNSIDYRTISIGLQYLKSFQQVLKQNEQHTTNN